MSVLVPERMRLAGYVSMTQHGFALPAYRLGPQANAWYVAVAAIDGDHAAPIVGFELLEDRNVIPVHGFDIEVSIGDPWQDVFLWNDGVFAGPPERILNALADQSNEVARVAPLSFLDLAFAANVSDVRDLVRSARSFLEDQLGPAAGAASFGKLVIVPYVSLGLRRQLHSAGLNTELSGSTYGTIIREYEPWKFEAELLAETVAAIGAASAHLEFERSVGSLGDALGLSLRIAEVAHSDWEAPDRALAPQVLPSPRSIAVAQTSGDQVQPSRALLPPIVVFAADRRSVQIARYLEPPSEVAFGSEVTWDVGRYRVDRASADKVQVLDAADAVIHVCNGLTSDVRLARYAVAIALVGNETLQNPESLEGIRAIEQELSRETPFLIAPAPPSDGPSAIMNVAKAIIPYTNVLIDTTLARSPFWAGQPRHSIDRRMADIITAVGIVAALDDRLRSALYDLARGTWPLRILSFHGGRSALSTVTDDIASELSAFSLYESGPETGERTRINFEMSDRDDKRAHNVFIELSPHREHFKSLAEAAFAGAVGSRLPRENFINLFEETPESIRQTLNHPSLAIAMRPATSFMRTVVITAESPDLSTLRAANDTDAAVVRYTDRETIRALLRDDGPSRRPMPREVRLPPLYRYPRNRGLATRGVDVRDIIRIPEHEWGALLKDNDPSQLAGQERRYFESINKRNTGSELAIPLPAVRSAMNVGDGLAQVISGHSQRLATQDPILGKRVADLMAAWSRPSPGGRRWVIEDGRIPVELTALDPDEVPAQRLFMIDGDGAVPALLMSRPFAVWARALLPSATSWSSRFQVSQTFEAFPLTLSFAVTPAVSQSPPQLRLSPNGGQLSRLAQELERGLRPLAEVDPKDGPFSRALRGSPLLQEIDSVLLADFGLDSEASDLDILERLVDRNQRRE